jgi:hypothetical protein
MKAQCKNLGCSAMTSMTLLICIFVATMLRKRGVEANESPDQQSVLMVHRSADRDEHVDGC